MKYCEIKVKVDGKVIKTISNIEVNKRAALEITENSIDMISLSELQERIWCELSYDKLLDTSISEFYDCDNVETIIEFVDKWVCETYIRGLTNYYYKKYRFTIE